MLRGARHIALFTSLLVGCAGIVGEPDRNNSGGVDASVDPINGGGDGGAANGGQQSSNGGRDGGPSAGRDGGPNGSNGGSGDAGANSVPQGNPADTCGNGTEALTAGLKIKEISLYQVIKVPLFQNGAWVTSRASKVVQGKKSLIRVFVDKQASFTAHAVRGVLTLDNGTPKYLTADLTPSASSTDATLGSTFNFTVEGTDITASTKLSVALVDKTCPTMLGSAADARFPASGTQALNPDKVGKLRVVIVPVSINGSLPDTSPTSLDSARKALLAYYPVPDVEVTVRSSPITWSSGISANGTGWSNLLNQIIQTRGQDNPADDIYYFGWIRPVSSFMSYCGFGCVLGLAPQTTRRSADQQAGLGVGYGDDHTATTIVHELGHAHGRGHAPCAPGGNIDGVDPNYPDSMGATTTWGWDSRSGTLQTPDEKDIMGYCEPTWIGDYNYNALAARSLQVNTTFRVSARGSEWHNLLLYGDGTARWGGIVTSREPGGDVESAQVLDDNGKTIASIEVIRIPLSHSEDSFLYVPKPDASWARIVLADRSIDLRAVAPAL